MGKKSVLIILLSFIFTQHINAQFGLGKAIKNKVDQKKEPEQKSSTPAPKAEEPKKELTPEEKEAELRKIKFFAKGMEDAALEQECIKAISRTPDFFDLDNMNQLALLHITSFDWVVKKDNYGSIDNKQIMVCMGIKKDGKCYRKEFYFKKNYMGGGQYSETLQGTIPTMLDYKKEMSCVVLDSLMQIQAAKSKPAATTKPASTVNSLSAKSTTTTTKPATTTTTAKSANTTASSTTTKPSVLSTMPTQVVSLSAIGINAIMTVPKGTTVRKEGEFRIIGNDKVEIQAEVTTLTLTEMKNDVKTNDLYNGTGKIVSSNANGFIFTCIEDEEEGKWAHLEFFKTIGGKKYRFIDNRLTEEPYTVEDLQPFLEALNTLP
ncbi:MAG TPA: hypothetical protein PLS10_00455 [Chitinophagales bacterium]|nr:hypothetical protein [Chitinophagales bacterium]